MMHGTLVANFNDKEREWIQMYESVYVKCTLNLAVISATTLFAIDG